MKTAHELLKSKDLHSSNQFQVKELELKTPEELVDSWAEVLESGVQRPLSTTISKFDDDIRNKLRGTIGAYIGYGGTKKSLLATQACRANVLQYKNNCTGIYSNMEMGVYQFLTRLIDMSFEKVEGYRPSYYYERVYEANAKAKAIAENKKLVGIMKESLKKYFGRNLYINSQSNMNVDDFHSLVKKAKAQNGQVDILVIDGLSMMAGSGNETESYTTNSKELKDLAKLHNIYIPLICHLSKGAEKHTREVQRYIRGSEKILDNVDFVIQMSLCIDESRSTPEVTEYLSDKGYMRFFNKRGTGNTINVIYDFLKDSLCIKETSDDPILYEVKSKNKTKNYFQS